MWRIERNCKCDPDTNTTVSYLVIDSLFLVFLWLIVEFVSVILVGILKGLI